MKAKLIVAGILIGNVAVLWALAHRYEFHTGMNGAIIWRCNKFTGKTEHSSFGESKWVTVSDPKPIAAEKLSTTDEFGGILVEPASKTAWTPPEVLAEEKARAGVNSTNQPTK